MRVLMSLEGFRMYIRTHTMCVLVPSLHTKSTDSLITMAVCMHAVAMSIHNPFHVHTHAA